MMMDIAYCEWDEYKKVPLFTFILEDDYDLPLDELEWRAKDAAKRRSLMEHDIGEDYIHSVSLELKGKVFNRRTFLVTAYEERLV